MNLLCILDNSDERQTNYSHTGRWEVVTENSDGQEERHFFDAVICCSGHFTYPNMPLKHFHSWDYKGPEDMHRRRVVVTGIGNSGGDIAVEGSRVAEQVGTSCLTSHVVIKHSLKVLWCAKLTLLMFSDDNMCL